MKRIARFFAVMAVAAVLGLGMASCDNGSGSSKNDGPTYTPGTGTGSGGTSGTTPSGSGEKVFAFEPNVLNKPSYFSYDLPPHTIRAFKPSTTPPPSEATKYDLGHSILISRVYQKQP